MLFHRCLPLLACVAALSAQTFDSTVRPVLTKTCLPCHNEQNASAGLNIAGFTKATSLTSDRPGWDRILDKLRAGEIPPKPIPRPTELDAVNHFVQSELDKAVRNLKPAPGRVTARRLNRAEYTN